MTTAELEAPILLPVAATNGVKYEKLSNSYDLIDTESVVRLLKEEGFYATAANQLKPRKRDPRVVRHYVRMRHESYAREINGSVPEILIINSNDGSSSLRMEAGLFRMVCSNGLIVRSAEIASVRIRHLDVTAERVMDSSMLVMNSAKEAARRIDLFRSRTLSQEEVGVFAARASQLWGGRVDPQQLLTARRTEDEGHELWSVFNRVQENLFKGGVVGRSANGRRTRTHGIRAMDNSVKVNTKLWEIAEEML